MANNESAFMLTRPQVEKLCCDVGQTAGPSSRSSNVELQCTLKWKNTECNRNVETQSHMQIYVHMLTDVYRFLLNAVQCSNCRLNR